MNNFIKSQFNIKDLENLSGVKAHTIRIWEKRYKLLKPKRTDTNIRYYDNEDLQRILNVALLNNNGFKISKIANLNDQELLIAVREFIMRNEKSDYAIHSFKLAMINFDYHLFDQTYHQLSIKKSFREIFLDVFVVLLEQIGLLWQSNTITPAHEHFISNLIKQKLQLQIEKVQALDTVKNEMVFVLFLPQNEIHELGLMFVHMTLLLNGYSSIYLGQSIPLYSLKGMHKLHDQINFISYFTIMPPSGEVNSYIDQMHQQILRPNKDLFYVLGKKTEGTKLSDYQGVRAFKSIQDLLDVIC